MFLPSRLQLEAVAAVAAVAAGMWLHSVWDGYKENQAREDMVVEHEKDVVADETAGLAFGATLTDIAITTTNGLAEIHNADLKPKTITVYVDKPGEVVCPVRSQWTPDLIRLFNDPGSAAPAADADGGVRALPDSDPATGGVRRDGSGEAEHGGG